MDLPGCCVNGQPSVHQWHGMVKRTFFKQHNSIYQKLSYVDNNVLLYFFQNTRYVILWHRNLVHEITQKKYLNNISVVYHKAIKRVCGRNSYGSSHECLEYARLPIFKHFLARKFVCYAHRLLTSKNPCLIIHIHYLKYN